MSLTEYARSELTAAGLMDEDSDYGGDLGRDVLLLIEVFDQQGHSGTSAAAVADLFKRLSSYQPLSPLTGEDDEWIECADGVFQNNRCSTVFRDGATGEAYDINGIVFEDADGNRYTGSESRVAVTFPYTPTTEYRRAESPQD